jgi:DNA-binding NtrC family response regulator
MHAASPRAKLPFRVINVRGVAINALESVLFGHEQGAFPGAFDRQIGVLQQCDTGTVVLDEINRMPTDVQERLAEALASGRIRPIGARHSFRIDVRIIAAANQKLSDMVEAGTFREDLCQILSPTRISLPPLRERAGDIRPLARYFLRRIGDQPGLREFGVTDGALSLLGSFDWPGNVRQLQAVLFRAAVHCDGDALTAADFPHLCDIIGSNGSAEEPIAHQSQDAGVMLYSEDGNLRPLEEIEADVIRLAIGHYRGRMTEVARRLGIGRSTLYRKLTNLGIDNAA